MRTYEIFDNTYRYVILLDNGFTQVVSNLSLLRKAIRYWRALGYTRLR